MAAQIEEYAFIGDLQTGALVSRDGSIDWLCFPRFDSGACFANLLGTPEHGRWLLTPDAEIREIRRRYRDDTLILETEYVCAGGSAVVIDFMPPRTAAPDLIRIVEGRRGEVPMKTELIIRFDYGSIVPWVRNVGTGIRAVAGPDTLYCRTPVQLKGEDLHTVAHFRVCEGQRTPFHLTYTPTYQPAPADRDVQDCLRDAETWWKEWCGRCGYRGRWSDAVRRSLIVLKALTYAPTGGLVAAATTSLPEHLGGIRNWDYRYCWLRDATFTLYALMVGGYRDEACAWRDWLINSVAGTPSRMQNLYGVTGQRRLPESEISWLPGYENSGPVRVGNGASEQHQLDVYGELMDTLDAARSAGLHPDENAWRIQRALLEFLESDWHKPDNGIWEVRGPRRHFTHSKVMAWVGFDRAARAVARYGLDGDARKWSDTASAIRADILEKGFNTKVNSFVQFYGSEYADASLLMLPMVGFIPADDPRMLGTVKFITERLMRNGFLKRYDDSLEIDGLPKGEGVFLMCTFWLIDNYALQGRKREAEELFERALDVCNEVGLLSEEYEPVTRRFLGNMPQAFSHVGLINSARNLDREGGPAEHRGGIEPGRPL